MVKPVARCRPLMQPLEARRLLSAAGLNYGYYEGSWSTLPNFATLTPVKQGLTHNVDPSVRVKETNYAMQWKGNLAVATAGTYTFYTASDDGSALYIDGTRVVNNDGLHAFVEAGGSVSLSAGTHTITAQYFQAGGGQRMVASYQGPGVNKQTIPDSVLTGADPGNVLVQNYGAVGNGTVDDSAAIQSAINAAPDGATLQLQAGKTYKLNTGLVMSRPLNVKGNGATLLLNTSAYPQNETVYYESPSAAASTTWSGVVSAGQTMLNVPVSTDTLEPGDTVFVELGTDPHDNTQPHWAEVCQVVSNSGQAVTIDTPVPYDIVQGSLPNRITRLTDVAQNVAFDGVKFDYVDGTTPDANLWLAKTRNFTVSNLTGRFSIMANVTDSRNVTVTGTNGTLKQLTSSSGRMVSAWQTDGLNVTNNTIATADDAPVVFLESWERNTTISGLTVNWNDASASSQDVFHFTGNSYNTTADNVTINNTAAINLVQTGSQPASYAFGKVTINGPVKSAPLKQIGTLINGGHTYTASSRVTSTFTVNVGSNWSDYQVALCSGVVASMSFNLSNLTGVNGLYVTNSNNAGSQLIGSLAAGQTATYDQQYGTDNPFDDPSAPAKKLHFYTGTVPAGTTLSVSVTYYA